MASAADAAGPRAVVGTLNGTVERKTGATWTQLRVGDALAETDVVRTAAGASAQLVFDSATVEISDRSQLTVTEITQTLSQIDLSEGRVVADVVPSADGAFRIAGLNRDAVVEARDGRFAVLESGKGELTVAAERGSVRFSARGAEVVVNAGQQSTAGVARSPSAPTAIPPSLFLKVAVPGDGRARVSSVVGETRPGAVVSINGARHATDPQGKFRVPIELVEGNNQIVVEVDDVSGRHEQRVVRKRIDTSGPAVGTQVTW